MTGLNGSRYKDGEERTCGWSADLTPILAICNRYAILVIENAAEPLGAAYKGRAPGAFGKAGIFSFNGNKIITTSGGGMLVSDDADFIAHARKLATQARDPAPHYQHSEIGYNYRMSNVLAGIGRGQLQVLEDRVQARRRNFQYYVDTLGDLPGIAFMPEAPWGRHTRWLTVITVDPSQFGADREAIRLALEAEGRGQRSGVRGQGSEVRGQRSGGGGRRYGDQVGEGFDCLSEGISTGDGDF